MLNLAQSTCSALDRATPVEFHEPSSVLLNRPRPAARSRTETGRAELSQRGLGGGAARWRGWRLPGAGQPVRGVRRSGGELRRRSGGEIRGRPSCPRPQRRVFDADGEAVSTAVIARSASDEAIHSCYLHSRHLDCFAEPVIGRRYAPTRWLAMTEKPITTISTSPRTAPARPLLARRARPATSRDGRARKCRPASR